MFGERRLICRLAARSKQVAESTRDNAGHDEQHGEHSQRYDGKSDRPCYGHRNRVAAHRSGYKQREERKDGGEYHHPTDRVLLAGHGSDFQGRIQKRNYLSAVRANLRGASTSRSLIAIRSWTIFRTNAAMRERLPNLTDILQDSHRQMKSRAEWRGMVRRSSSGECCRVKPKVLTTETQRTQRF